MGERVDAGAGATFEAGDEDWVVSQHIQFARPEAGVGAQVTDELAEVEVLINPGTGGRGDSDLVARRCVGLGAAQATASSMNRLAVSRMRRSPAASKWAK